MQLMSSMLPSGNSFRDLIQRAPSRALLIGTVVALIVIWALVIWAALMVVDAVYQGGFAGGIFDDLLSESDWRPLPYYHSIVW